MRACNPTTRKARRLKNAAPWILDAFAPRYAASRSLLNALRRSLRIAALKQPVEERRADEDRAVGTDDYADEHRERERVDAGAAEDIENEHGERGR